MKLLIVGFALLTCTSIAAQNWNGYQTQNSLKDYVSKKDISYVADGKVYHKLDIYYPKEEKESYPVIIHIYGSAWLMNDYKGSADLGTMGETSLKNGYIFVTPNHRSCNDAVFPAQLNDIKAVVRYLRGNAESLKIDTSFIGISGFSSGGHLASLMGTTRNEKVGTKGNVTFDLEGNLGDYLEYSSSVDAVCNWSGPICLTKEDGCGLIMNSNGSYEASEMGCEARGNEDKYALATAISYIDPSDPPFLIVHGSKDNIVPQCQGERFNQALQDGSVVSEFVGTSGDHKVDANSMDKMVRFFNEAREKKAQNKDLTRTEELKDKTYDIYENSGVVYIPIEENIYYQILDVSGKIVQKGIASDGQIDVKRLRKGLYYISFVHEDNMMIKDILLKEKK